MNKLYNFSDPKLNQQIQEIVKYIRYLEKRIKELEEA